MNTNKKTNIFLVDDDEMYLKLLEVQLAENTTYHLRKFTTGEECLEHLVEKPDIIILDYYLNSIEQKALDGLETLRKIKLQYPELPVIMLSSQDKIDVAVNCMKLNAFDYIVKSETAIPRLNKAIANLIQQNTIAKTLRWYIDKL